MTQVVMFDARGRTGDGLESRAGAGRIGRGGQAGHPLTDEGRRAWAATRLEQATTRQTVEELE